MGFQVLLGEQPREFLDHLHSVGEEPHARPDAGRGDSERLPIDGRELYRMHISRTFTALNSISESESVVRVRELLPTDDAHKRYG
jgi:hypothetical protein